MRRRFLTAILITLIVALATSPVAFADDGIDGDYAHALWEDSFESATEVADSADLVILGTVVRQETELRHDMVFTRSYISVSKNYTGNDISEVCVLQTGGVYGEYHTPPIENADILNIGTNYILYLQYSAANEFYDDYYLILGGTVGIVTVDSITAYGVNSQIRDADVLSGSILQIDSAPISTHSNGTDIYGGKWMQSTVTFYVYSLSGASSSYYTNVASGIKLWNGVSSNIKYSQVSDSVSPDLFVFSNYYGNTGWYGYSYMYNAADQQTYRGEYAWAKIQLNVSAMATTNKTKWKAVACHEAGHVLGLAHSDNTAQSVMIEDDDKIFSTYYAPQTADKANIRTIYGS